MWGSISGHCFYYFGLLVVYYFGLLDAIKYGIFLDFISVYLWLVDKNAIICACVCI